MEALTYYYPTMGLTILSERFIAFRPTIVLIAFERVDHFSKVLSSISKLFGIEDFNVCLVIQKGNLRVFDLAQEFNLDNKSILLSDFKRGISAKQKINFNIFSGINYAFEKHQSPFVVVLEDDTVLVPDALCFFKSVHINCQNSKKFMGINAFSDYKELDNQGEREAAYISGNYGLGWGWSVNMQQFTKLKKYWKGLEDEHWDALIEPYLRTGFVINPVRSRVINYGLDGTGTNSKKSDQLFETMKQSAKFTGTGRCEFYEMEQFRPRQFWREDYLVLSGRAGLVKHMVTNLYYINFYLWRVFHIVPHLKIFRKVYTLMGLIVARVIKFLLSCEDMIFKSILRFKPRF
jgi:hypothetical protein